MRKLEEFIDSQERAVVEYDEALVCRLIERGTVYDDHFTVGFKSGLETGVIMEKYFMAAQGNTQAIFLDQKDIYLLTSWKRKCILRLLLNRYR